MEETTNNYNLSTKKHAYLYDDNWDYSRIKKNHVFQYATQEFDNR